MLVAAKDALHLLRGCIYHTHLICHMLLVGVMYHQLVNFSDGNASMRHKVYTGSGEMSLRPVRALALSS